MNGLIKKQIKKTRYFQNRRSKKHFDQMRERLAKLANDEKPSREKTIYFNRDKVKQFETMLKEIDITLRYDMPIQSWIDTGIFFVNSDASISNTSPDYGLIIYNSIEKLKEMNYPYDGNEAKESNYRLLCAVETYIDRVIDRFRTVMLDCPEEYKKDFVNSKLIFERMKQQTADSVYEALQRIAFWSDLFWQSGHDLMGFGRLDLILDNINSNETDEEITTIIKSFYDAMHRYYPFKSSLEAMGDTGQIIALGGKMSDGSYFCNRYTHLFIKALATHTLPDPKLLLRVADNMPEELLYEAVKLISLGVGSPLLANDEVIVPALIRFGYSEEDAYNFVTSACWEPIAYGKSSEVNNIRSVNYAEALVQTYQDQKFVECITYSELLNLYKNKLSIYVDTIIESMNQITWEEDPLLTFFTLNCAISGKEISNGGAEYNNYGLLGDGMGNTVNSLLLMKHGVFDLHKYTLSEIRSLCLTDYDGNDKFRLQLLEDSNYYGKDVDEVVELTELLKSAVYEKLGNYMNKYGGSVKWGISSSNYMRNGRRTLATPDGRKAGEALNVHISGKGVAYTELFHFASHLNYDGKYSNGNVIDYFISPNMFSQYFDKIALFIKSTIKLGFFEQQINVVSSEMLIDAKKHPEKHPDLIVRVWGFSAYFNDLTEDYKDLLITRAIESEKVS